MCAAFVSECCVCIRVCVASGLQKKGNEKEETTQAVKNHSPHKLRKKESLWYWVP